MLHVCAVPGVETACATSVSHTMLNTNLLVCAPCLVLFTLMSVGLITNELHRATPQARREVSSI